MRKFTDCIGGASGGSGEHRKKSRPSADEDFPETAVDDRVFRHLPFHEEEGEEEGRNRKRRKLLACARWIVTENWH